MVYRGLGRSITPFVAGDRTASSIESSQQRVVVDDIPDAIVHLLESEILSGQRIGQEELARLEAECSTWADSSASWGTRRADALVNDAELYPPDVELAQAMDPGPREGTPLSVRIASGIPTSWKSLRKAPFAPLVRTEGRPLQSKSMRL